MQTKEIIESNLAVAKEQIEAAQQRQKEAFVAWQNLVPTGKSRSANLLAYNKLVEAEKETLRAEIAAGVLEWVLSEPVGWKHFDFYSREAYQDGPSSGHYCGRLVFMENTPEVQQLIDAGYLFTRTPAGEYPRAGSAAQRINDIDTAAEFEQLVASTTNFRLSMSRPDLTN